MYLELGSVQDALATECQMHKPLIALLHTEQVSREEDDGLETVSDTNRDIHSSGNCSGPIRLHKAGDTYTKTSNLYCDYHDFSDMIILKLWLAHSSAVPSHPGMGRILNPAWIDLSIARDWKRHCLSSPTHTQCQNPLKILPTRPAWLVDVEKLCLVPGHTSGAYVALSYVWGKRTQGVRIVPSMLEAVQRPGALAEANILGRIAPTVQHAIYLTSILEERYLWTDTLCIIHETEEAAGQLGLMGMIYANAIVTIMATDGNAQDGIAGMKGVPYSNPRNLESKKQHVFQVGNEKILIRQQLSRRHRRLTPDLNSGTYDETRCL